MKEIGKFQFASLCMLERKRSIEFLEFSPTARERCESLSQNPCREPAFRCGEALKALDGFEPSIELLVHALDEIGGPRTIDMEECFCSDVGGEFFAALEDVLHDRDFERIVLMPR